MAKDADFDEKAMQRLTKLLGSFVELLISLTTRHGKLVQGAPTSPWLQNIYQLYSGLVAKIARYLDDNNVYVHEKEMGESETKPLLVFSFYSDDLTVSSTHPMPWQVKLGLIKLIEQESCFRINWEKLRKYRRASCAPLVTGLRVGTITRTERDLRLYLNGSNMSQEEQKRFIENSLNDKGQWVVPNVSLPKKKIKMIRNMIHVATHYPDLREELERKIAGHISCLHDIYGLELPRQIAVPYEKYQASLQS